MIRIQALRGLSLLFWLGFSGFCFAEKQSAVNSTIDVEIRDDAKCSSWTRQLLTSTGQASVLADQNVIILSLRDDVTEVKSEQPTKTSEDGTDATEIYLVFHLEFDSVKSCETFKEDGFYPITKFDRFLDVFVDVESDAIKKLDGIAGLKWYEVDPRPLLPPPPRVAARAERSRQTADQVVNDGLLGMTGKGVLIAIVDSGIDFRHPDFLTKDSNSQITSRVQYFWDLSSDAYANGIGSPAPFQYPNGAAIGTVYDLATLNREIRGEISRIPVWDINGHGTACASVAAANAENGKKGVAPQADIIAIRIAGDDEEEGLPHAYMLGAICEWLDQIAKDRPVVISCSWGSQAGGHDGFNLIDRQLNARFADNIQKRVLCLAAGNDGASPTHSSIKLTPKSKSQTISWSAPIGGELSIYLDSSDPDQFQVLEKSVQGVSQISGFLHPLTQQIVLGIQLSAGDGKLTIESRSMKEIAADAYIVGPGSKFDDDCAAFEKLLSSPGSSAQAITVGSYDWNDEFHRQGKTVLLTDPVTEGSIRIGEISSYSSPGPLRLGAMIKPDIVAPGQWFTAAAPRNSAAFRDSTGNYRSFNGTSAATPYTAGVIALLLEKKSTLTVGQIKRLLKTHASRDAHTGNNLPNGTWGNGKLDLDAVKKMLADPLLESAVK